MLVMMFSLNDVWDCWVQTMFKCAPFACVVINWNNLEQEIVVRQ